MSALAGLVFLQMALIVAVSQAVGYVFRWLQQPLVVAQMLTGILLGPSLFGLLLPGVAGHVFPASSMGTLRALGNVGLVLYIFNVGVSVPHGSIRRLATSAGSVAAASIVVPLAAGAVLGWSLVGQDHLFPADKPQWISILFFATAMSATAFPVMARIIDERGLRGTGVANLALAAGSFTDAAAWCLLAVVVGAITGSFSGLALAVGGSLVFTIGVLRFGPNLLRRVFDDRDDQAPWQLPLMLLLLMAAAFFTEFIGVHPALGAFVLGLAMPKTKQVARMQSMLAPLAVNLLLPLFLVYAGLNTKIGLLASGSLIAIAAVIVVVACIAKGAACFAASFATGQGWRESVSIGALMNARGLVELIILTTGLEAGVITPALYSIMVVMAVLTTLLASPVIQLALRPSPTPGPGSPAASRTPSTPAAQASPATPDRAGL